MLSVQPQMIEPLKSWAMRYALLSYLEYLLPYHAHTFLPAALWQLAKDP